MNKQEILKVAKASVDAIGYGEDLRDCMIEKIVDPGYTMLLTYNLTVENEEVLGGQDYLGNYERYWELVSAEVDVTDINLLDDNGDDVLTDEQRDELIKLLNKHLNK